MRTDFSSPVVVANPEAFSFEWEEFQKAVEESFNQEWAKEEDARQVAENDQLNQYIGDIINKLPVYYWFGRSSNIGGGKTVKFANPAQAAEGIEKFLSQLPNDEWTYLEIIDDCQEDDFDEIYSPEINFFE